MSGNAIETLQGAAHAADEEWDGYDGSGIHGYDPDPEAVRYVLGGRMVARKAGPRTRTHGEMVAMGAECVGAFSKHKFRMVLA